MVTTVDTFLVLVGANDPDGLINLNENPATTDKNVVAIPYNAVYSTISDVTTEYAPAGNPLVKCTNMRETEIQYQVSERGRVELKVFDTSGRLVKILAEQTHDPGYYRTIWDAKDETGRGLSAGIYFITFTVGTHGNHDYAIVNKAVFVGT